MKRIIDLRVDRMVAQGLFDEVRALVESGVPRTATAMQAIGYKECLGCLAAEQGHSLVLPEKFPRSSRRFTIFDRNSHEPWRILILYGRHP